MMRRLEYSRTDFKRDKYVVAWLIVFRVGLLCDHIARLLLCDHIVRVDPS